jgi:hypothetical protein
MTDTPPVPETPATPPAASVPPAAPGYAPVAAGPKQTLSLVGFIGGIAAFVLSWVFVLGFLISLGAIIVSVMAHKREPGAPKWMYYVGLIGGIVGLVGSLASASLGTVTQY